MTLDPYPKTPSYDEFVMMLDLNFVNSVLGVRGIPNPNLSLVINTPGKCWTFPIDKEMVSALLRRRNELIAQGSGA